MSARSCVQGQDGPLKTRGRPVKLRLTREEEFYTTFVRQGLVAHFKMGCDKEGRLLAMENRFYWDGGAYTEYGVNMTRSSGYSSSGPYDVPNVKTDSYCVYTNHPVGGPMRGFGMPQVHTGLEQCIDELAYAMHMDPVQFRKLNCIQTGDTLVTGMTMHPTGLSECLLKAAEAIRWGRKDPPSAPNKRWCCVPWAGWLPYSPVFRAARTTVAAPRYFHTCVTHASAAPAHARARVPSRRVRVRAATVSPGGGAHALRLLLRVRGGPGWRQGDIARAHGK